MAYIPKTQRRRYYKIHTTPHGDMRVEARTFIGDAPDDTWIRGIYYTPQKKVLRSMRASKSLRGLRKSTTTRERMSAASKNRPKSETHCRAMSVAQQQRAERVHQLQSKYPQLTYRECSKLLKEIESAGKK